MYCEKAPRPYHQHARHVAVGEAAAVAHFAALLGALGRVLAGDFSQTWDKSPSDSLFDGQRGFDTAATSR
jgi:hypothetical protein